MDNLFKNFLREESGATAIEYALLAALIAVVIISAISQLGAELEQTFNTVSTKLDDAQRHSNKEKRKGAK
jgi:pilus assembly protein Flp/PilA